MITSINPDCICAKIKAWARELDAFAQERDSKNDIDAACVTRMAVRRLFEILTNEVPPSNPPSIGNERVYLIGSDEGSGPFVSHSYFSLLQWIEADLSELGDGDRMKFSVKRNDMTAAEIAALPEYDG